MRRSLLTLTAVATVWLTGCSGEEVIYPHAPPSYPMYDTSSIDTEQNWNISNVHDPSIIKEGDTYYIFSTDVKVGGTAKPGLMVRKSNDLLNWQWVGYALDGVPAEAEAWTGATGMWAPEVAKLGDRFYLYYSASTFGSNRSFIGVATSDSLEGPWTDQGEVVKTGPGDEPNAIDPNIVNDAEGKPWFVYGSFFGGIYVSPLDPSTGKLKEQGYGTKIAARAVSESGAVEGPYMIYNAEHKQYYLFVSYDSLSQDYNVRVGRSASITGPFLDSLGRDMLDTAYDPTFDVGNKLMGGYRFSEGEGWIAPGHNSILQDGGSDYIVHHARPEQDPNWMYLHVRKLLWTEDGWPVVSPERYAGEQLQALPKAELVGTWERIVHEKYIDGPIDSEFIELRKDGKLGAEASADYWEFDGEHTLRLYFQEDDQQKAAVETVLVIPAWDWERNKPTLIFTGMDDDGLAVWGKQVK